MKTFLDDCQQQFQHPHANLDSIITSSAQLQAAITDYVYEPDTEKVLDLLFPDFVSTLETLYALSLQSPDKQKWQPLHATCLQLYDQFYQGPLSVYIPPNSVVPYSWLLTQQEKWHQKTALWLPALQAATDTVLAEVLQDYFKQLTHVTPGTPLLYKVVKYCDVVQEALLSLCEKKMDTAKLLFLLVQLEFNTSYFVQYYMQYHTRQQQQLTNIHQRTNYICTRSFEVSNATLGLYRRSPYHIACPFKPTLKELLEPYFKYEIISIETDSPHTVASPQPTTRLQTDKTPMELSFYLKQFAERAGLLKKHTFLEICEFFCAHITVIHNPTIDPSSLVAYTQRRHQKINFLEDTQTLAMNDIHKTSLLIKELRKK
ncbi:hypothetical protein [Filimonas lacunae]|nr:hypothetical protein [Filimonas lacunae]